MAGTFKFELVSPERVLLSEDVEHVVLPGIDGDLGVLPGHSPIVVTLRPGLVTVYGESKVRRIFVKDGFAEFTPDTLNVLAEQAVNLDGAGVGVVSGLIAAAEKDLAEATDDGKRFMAHSALDALRAV
ncbi:MAG: ATP synthase F1 subunit epsilon [Alphaproteobacteria bacterium]|nr:ATP synthase F1 subunit epsilon [Alphaproteobacteria bacterium]